MNVRTAETGHCVVGYGADTDYETFLICMGWGGGIPDRWISPGSVSLNVPVYSISPIGEVSLDRCVKLEDDDPEIGASAATSAPAVFVEQKEGQNVPSV